MYERILVPLDGSHLSEAALEHAEAIANQFRSTLILLQVMPPPDQVSSEVPEEMIRTTVEQEYAEAERYVAAVAEHLAAEQIPTETRIVVGHAADEILTLAAAARVSLVVMATHGRGGLGKAIFGSVAGEVLRGCRLPLLLIHPE